MPRAAKEPIASKKKAKDPNAPKKPCGAYMWFCKEMREAVKADNPGASVTDIGRRLGELWKEANEEEKRKFHKLADEDKERYNRENARYTMRAKAQ
ncbi:hypothetical protein HYH03_002099 [Edaphochlamys debaryana]|uniref:HMG box domain-containing protein n=1 Tax=Edaphochlamys debaryana TaxID=47281 RepID=A0A835YBU8_9CHLO|nr:hypothetical protein HYH03_002099 [Edaphochlamys debaryana]|eukprot:KAG2499803.1 hypothetical protein HYH03_002099 [Edaphochlamys debaryana]